MRSRLHPDGREFVRDPDPEALAQALTDVYCTVDASELGSFVALGFEVHRREGTYRVPARGPRVRVPHGVVLLQADEVDEVALRLLDDELRQDVPGAQGWRWGEAEFHAETYAAPDFDPTTYLVALDSKTGEQVGNSSRVDEKADPTARLHRGAAQFQTPRNCSGSPCRGLRPTRGARHSRGFDGNRRDKRCLARAVPRTRCVPHRRRS